MKACWTAVRFRPSPPKCIKKYIWVGMTRFRQREIANKATREAMDVIQAKTVDAEKANTLGTVKVTMGKNFRFGRQASNDSAVLLAA